MNLRKNILVNAALALTWAAPLFAGPVAYREAAAPWSSAQAAKLTPAITAEFLKEVKKDFGAGAAAGLSEKKEKVSALLARFKDRKSTRLNSSHSSISYAVFCLKKKI